MADCARLKTYTPMAGNLQNAMVHCVGFLWLFASKYALTQFMQIHSNTWNLKRTWTNWIWCAQFLQGAPLWAMQKAKGAATNATLAHGPCGRGPCGPRLQLSDPVKPTSHEKKHVGRWMENWICLECILKLAGNSWKAKISTVRFVPLSACSSASNWVWRNLRLRRHGERPKMIPPVALVGFSTMVNRTFVIVTFLLFSMLMMILFIQLHWIRNVWPHRSSWQHKWPEAAPPVLCGRGLLLSCFGILIFLLMLFMICVLFRMKVHSIGNPSSRFGCR